MKAEDDINFEEDIRALVEKEERQPPPAVWSRIESQLSRPPRVRFLWLRTRWPSVAMLAASMLLLVLSTVWLMRVDKTDADPIPTLGLQSQSPEKAGESPAALLPTAPQAVSKDRATLIIKPFVTSVQSKAPMSLAQRSVPSPTRKANASEITAQRAFETSIAVLSPDLRQTCESSELLTAFVKGVQATDSSIEREDFEFDEPRRRAFHLAVAGGWSGGSENGGGVESGAETLSSNNFSLSSESFAKEFGSFNSENSLTPLFQDELNTLNVVSNWATGIQAGLGVSRRLDFEMGLMLQRLQLVSSLRYAVLDHSSGVLTPVADVMNRAGASDLSVWPLKGSETASHTGWYVQTPVRAAFRLGQRQLHVRLTAGAAAHWLVRHDRRLSLEGIEASAGRTILSPWYISVQLSAAAHYALGKRLSIFLEPSFQQPVTSVVNDQYINYRPVSLGLNCGLSYRFQ